MYFPKMSSSALTLYVRDSKYKHILKLMQSTMIPWVKNDWRNSGGTLRQKFNLIDF